MGIFCAFADGEISLSNTGHLVVTDRPAVGSNTDGQTTLFFVGDRGAKQTQSAGIFIITDFTKFSCANALPIGTRTFAIFASILGAL